MLSRALLAVMLTIFTGSPAANLDTEELGNLLWALNGFRERPIPESDGPSGIFKPSVPKDDYGGAVHAPPRAFASAHADSHAT